MNDGGGSLGPLQDASRGVAFFADVAHTNDALWIPDLRRSRDVANFSAAQRQRRPWLGYHDAGEEQSGPLPVHLPTGSHALHNFLPGVAALRIADMAILQSGLVRDLLLAEVI